ncbi:Uncharacterised protein [Mycobacteroides abscessus subsp. massiliense]|nr:Uncharacterised protein [Mycobacteroides abscessus subsp. massiliense]
MPARAAITVRPENVTVSPEVAIAAAIASCRFFPEFSSSRYRMRMKRE